MCHLSNANQTDINDLVDENQESKMNKCHICQKEVSNLEDRAFCNESHHQGKYFKGKK